MLLIVYKKVQTNRGYIVKKTKVSKRKDLKEEARITLTELIKVFHYPLFLCKSQKLKKYINWASEGTRSGN